MGTRLKNLPTSEEQDQLFARLAAPKKAEHTIDIESFSDSDNDVPPWATRKQARPSSASQQRLCDRLAAPKKRPGRPQSATAKPCFVNPAAQQALTRRLSEPKNLSQRGHTTPSEEAAPASRCEDDSPCPQRDVFTAWGLFDEGKAALWAEQQTLVLEQLEQVQELHSQIVGNVTSAASSPAPPRYPHRKLPVPKLPSLESIVGAQKVPKLPPLETLVVDECCKYDNDPFDSDLETSDVASSMSSSSSSMDFSSDHDQKNLVSDDNEVIELDLKSTQLPARILPIQRPHCLATPDDETISNSNGLVGWQLTRGCVPWA